MECLTRSTEFLGRNHKKYLFLISIYLSNKQLINLQELFCVKNEVCDTAEAPVPVCGEFHYFDFFDSLLQNSDFESSLGDYHKGKPLCNIAITPFESEVR